MTPRPLVSVSEIVNSVRSLCQMVQGAHENPMLTYDAALQISAMTGQAVAQLRQDIRQLELADADRTTIAVMRSHFETLKAIDELIDRKVVALSSIGSREQ